MMKYQNKYFELTILNFQYLFFKLFIFFVILQIHLDLPSFKTLKEGNIFPVAKLGIQSLVLLLFFSTSF